MEFYLYPHSIENRKLSPCGGDFNIGILFHSFFSPDIICVWTESVKEETAKVYLQIPKMVKVGENYTSGITGIFVALEGEGCCQWEVCMKSEVMAREWKSLN